MEHHLGQGVLVVEVRVILLGDSQERAMGLCCGRRRWWWVQFRQALCALVVGADYWRGQ